MRLFSYILETRSIEKIYFAHARSMYHSKAEKDAIQLIEDNFPDHIVVNPNVSWIQGKVDDMGFDIFFKVIDTVSIVVYMPFKDTKVGNGTWRECQYAHKKGIPIYEVNPYKNTIKEMSFEKIKYLSPEETYNRINKKHRSKFVVYESKEDVTIYIKKPSDCTKEEKKTFLDLVLSGNQNTPSHVKDTFPKLIWVGLLYEGDEIKAVSSLKDGDAEDIFERAQVDDLDPEDYPYEIGFSFTAEDSRGKGYNTKLKDKLFAKVGNKGIFATIRVNNKASLAVNKKMGFIPVGIPYEGIVTDVQLMVYN